MNLKNYTSSVSAITTVGQIELLLAEAGATEIGKSFENGRLANITFKLTIDGKDILVRLPCNEELVFKRLMAEYRRPHEGTAAKVREQATRTAWRIQLEWLQIELSLIQLKQKEPLQVFLAYIWDGKQTFYTAIKERGFKGLLAAPKEP